MTKVDIPDPSAAVIPISAAAEIRRKREEANRPKCTRVVAEPGKVVLEFGEGWPTASEGESWAWTPEGARRLASALNLVARRAELLAAEALGGSPILIELRKRGAEGRARAFAERTLSFLETLCQPVAKGAEPNAELIELWKDLRGMLSLREIGDLWAVNPSKVGRLTRRKGR